MRARIGHADLDYFDICDRPRSLLVDGDDRLTEIQMTSEEWSLLVERRLIDKRNNFLPASCGRE